MVQELTDCKPCAIIVCFSTIGLAKLEGQVSTYGKQKAITANSTSDTVQVTNSVTKDIGPKGGKLELYDVSLEFPPDALIQPVEIILGINREQGQQSKVGDVETVSVSPLVSCEPHGLRLELPARLTVPHSLFAESSILASWKLSLMQKSTHEGIWTEITPGDYTPYVITADHITLQTSHFCVLKYLAQRVLRIGKVVKLATYASQAAAGDFFRINVCCVDRCDMVSCNLQVPSSFIYKEMPIKLTNIHVVETRPTVMQPLEQMKRRDEIKDAKAILLDGWKSLVVSPSGRNLNVSLLGLEKCERNWMLTGISRQVCRLHLHRVP